MVDIDGDGEKDPVYHIAGPIPIIGDQTIFNYSETESGEHLRSTWGNEGNCFADPNDPVLCPGGNCICGQDPLFRRCDGDVRAMVSIGLQGRQADRGNLGCGMNAPYATDDPFEPSAPPASGGTGGGGSGKGQYYIDPSVNLFGDPIVGAD
jgi:hypothetical protein